jgi:hypothetical protein
MDVSSGTLFIYGIHLNVNAKRQLQISTLLIFKFYPEDGGSLVLRRAGISPGDYMAQQPGRRQTVCGVAVNLLLRKI